MALFGFTGVPLEAQSLYRKALDVKNTGKNEDALKYLKMAVSIAPHFCSAYNAMGNCLDELGRYNEAIKKYETVLKLNPGHAEARFKLTMLQKKIEYSGEKFLYRAISPI
ncbi:MAG TPA: tetratricopeptide repeat protein [Methanoregula sp.]|nr:tetratricopeptide repeat protein [Methanoregula sp.]